MLRQVLAGWLECWGRDLPRSDRKAHHWQVTIRHYSEPSRVFESAGRNPFLPDTKPVRVVRKGFLTTPEKTAFHTLPDQDLPERQPPEKPLDTDREKSILIEDIVVDNPREGGRSHAERETIA